MVKFVSIFVAHPQSSSLCISLLETRWSVMTGTVRNIIEKEKPKLSSVGFWLFFLVLTECNCYCVGTRPQYDQMIKCNGILWFYLQNEAELFERKAFWYFFFPNEDYISILLSEAFWHCFWNCCGTSNLVLWHLLSKVKPKLPRSKCDQCQQFIHSGCQDS